MAEVKWVKITTDMFDNRKIKHLRRLPDGNNIVLIWVMLLTMAGRCNANGMIYLTEDIPYTPKMLADELDFEENTVRLALEALERLKMITTTDSVYSIANWEEYQNFDKLAEIREKEKLKKRRQRERARQLASNSEMSPGESGDNKGTCPQCPDIEREGEGEGEKEEEKENPFYLSTREEAKQKFLGGELGRGRVFISDEQIDDLLNKLSIEEFDHYVSVVADCEERGKRYGKTHYQAILDMAEKDRRKRK